MCYYKIHYGSTNEKYKIAYGKQAFASCLGKREFCQVRELQGIKETAYSLLFLRVLSRKESIRFGEKSRKETKERESEKGKKLVMASRTKAKLGTGLLINYIHFVH